MDYVPVKESITQKRCKACGFISIYETVFIDEFNSKTIFKCLSDLCGLEEPTHKIDKTEDILISINRGLVKKRRKNKNQDIQLDSDKYIKLSDKLNILISEIDNLKQEAEDIWTELKRSGIRVGDLPWTRRGWQTSKRYDTCVLCGTKFIFRQSYTVVNGEPQCRYGCSRDKDGS